MNSVLLRWCGRGCRGSSGRLAPGTAMALENTGWRKFTQLVADHVLRHKHARELLAVVHQEREADEIRHHGAITRPGLDRLLRSATAHAHGLGQQPLVHVRPLLQRTTHRATPFY